MLPTYRPHTTTHILSTSPATYMLPNTSQPLQEVHYLSHHHPTGWASLWWFLAPPAWHWSPRHLWVPQALEWRQFWWSPVYVKNKIIWSTLHYCQLWQSSEEQCTYSCSKNMKQHTAILSAPILLEFSKFCPEIPQTWFLAHHVDEQIKVLDVQVMSSNKFSIENKLELIINI